LIFSRLIVTETLQGSPEERMAIDEHEAVVRLQRGDISGLETLVRAYHARAVRCALLVVHDHALALDVTQAAFVRAYERIGQLDVQRSFGPWFLKSVLRDAVKAATRRGRSVSLDATRQDETSSTDVVDGEAGPEQLWEQRETAEAVLAALAQLTPAERAAVVQRYYLGLSEAEMATASGSPRGTVKWRLHAAREKLRGLLQPLDPDREMLR
jgi:RNA polymerase sigma-70 factor (ECF subfamily)